MAAGLREADNVADLRRGWLAWLARHAAAALLAVTVAGLIAGGLLRLAGRADAADAMWFAVGGCGAMYALWSMADSLRRRRIGVDVIALLAVAGALAVGELLAAAVIGVMLASGRALEGWAAGRARRDLRTLLERAPKSARRYRGEAIETGPLELIRPGDLLMVAPGDVVPVDGTVGGVSCVLDESALTGEPLPVEHSPGEALKHGAALHHDAAPRCDRQAGHERDRNSENLRAGRGHHEHRDGPLRPGQCPCDCGTSEGDEQEPQGITVSQPDEWGLRCLGFRNQPDYPRVRAVGSRRGREQIERTAHVQHPAAQRLA